VYFKQLNNWEVVLLDFQRGNVSLIDCLAMTHRSLILLRLTEGYGVVMYASDNVRFWQLFVCIVAFVEIHFVAAQIDLQDLPADEVQSQVDLSKPLSWQEACKLVGTQDLALAEKIEKTLREALRLPQKSEVMACALILQCVGRGDSEAVKAALAGARSVFPQASVETQSLMARVRLWLWLTANEPKVAAYATGTFRELVTNTYRGELSKPELRAHSQLIGTVCGMLQSERAESPISADNLKIAEQCLSASKISDVKSRFKQSQQIGKRRAEAIEQTIERVNAKSPDDVADEQAARKAKLADLGYEFTNTRDLMIEIVRNSREVSRQNTLDRRKLADYMKRLIREWMIPTAGHPGQPPIEPRMPIESEIKVEEYTYETKYDKDGKKEREEKQDEILQTLNVNAARSMPNKWRLIVLTKQILTDALQSMSPC